MDPISQADPRDRNLDARIRRLAGWPLGSDGGRDLALGDLIEGEGEDVPMICRRILRTDGGPAELANLLRRARLDGEACPDPDGLAVVILSAVRNGKTGYEAPENTGAIALILVPSVIAGIGLAGGLSPYLAVLLVGAGWFVGWKLLRRD
ncbi:hypothetical protein [Zavarzinia compransoris]|uniref:Uncharacterized protein n=1 Tax=Zavarzinia compransoris TaxID=1264899 RepID=A0A317E2X3_9PROT|nr:hypothetical protein [Zavarzinia compransoris]PWR20520.1 hypothetical protein DKG75_10960 [Zavarzinia compransoris]TDP43835.1 hypothetical protein DES42_10991 [Zavarzinia compransoris]